MISFRWTKYTLPNGREVYLTNRPDCVEDDSVQEFLDKVNPLVRFSFTDDYVTPPYLHEEGDGPPWHWLPWVPGKNIPIENVFAFICMMDRIHREVDPKRKYQRPIWLHCDSSTMRAPTYFGLFLRAIYPDRVTEISDNFTSSKEKSNMGKFARPDTYSETSFKKDPGIEELITVWSQDGEKAAYKIYMKDDYAAPLE